MKFIFVLYYLHMEFIPSKKNIKFIHVASEQSYNSDMYHKHGSVITIGGKIIFCGHNYYTLKNNSTVFYSIHAEVDVLNKLLSSSKIKKKRKKKINLYVVRISPSGNYLNSKPCENCITILKKYKINKVFYSSNNGIFKVQKIK